LSNSSKELGISEENEDLKGEIEKEITFIETWYDMFWIMKIIT
jgi:hypothetical protein